MGDNKLADAYDREMEDLMEDLVAQEAEIDRLTSEVEHLDGQIQTLLNENKKMRALLDRALYLTDISELSIEIRKVLANEQDK